MSQTKQPAAWLLTGASGFLGKAILANNQHRRIVTLSRANADYCINLATDVPVWQHSFEVVIHAAGLAHLLSKKESANADYFGVNTQGTHNLLKALEQQQPLPQQFILISSVSVYGRESGQLISENDATLPQDAYGQSKLAAEKLVQSWCEERGVQYLIFRLPLIVGHNAPGNLGKMTQAIQKNRYVHIGGGEARKSMVLAKDIAQFILQNKMPLVSGIYNLTDGEHPTFAQLANKIQQRFGARSSANIPLWAAQLLGKAGDLLGNKFPVNSGTIKKITADLTFDDTKARKEIGWTSTSCLHFYE